MDKASGTLIAIGIIVVVVLLGGSKAIQIVDAGHVGVATLFGEVREEPYPEGLHFVNPFLKWTMFNARQQTLLETANVPTQDQMQVTMEVSVQYRLIPEMAPQILEKTGTLSKAVTTHLIPKLRSALREEGKSVSESQDFFKVETVRAIQQNLLRDLKPYLAEKGLEIQDILIRDITLPPTIMIAIMEKKKQQQYVERAEAALERKKVELQEVVVMAEAERDASVLRAEREIILADAESYRIQKINEAIADNSTYLQLQAIEALQAIANDPSAKIYFMNSSSPQPIPLMHMNDR